MGWKKPIGLQRNYVATAPDKKTSKEDMDRMMKEFFAKGGVIQKIPEGKKTKK
tara:strand:+ start:2659 stop:2817 length:159 start_codon:yes stop_codon:yes gene_type:complete